jgi:predicted nucleotidyltransferase
MEKITEEKIKKLCQKIVKKIKPEKIILFGSFAWGKPTKDSDVDLLIIKRTKKKWLQRHLEVRNVINGELPVDILVRTPEEVKKD